MSVSVQKRVTAAGILALAALLISCAPKAELTASPKPTLSAENTVVPEPDKSTEGIRVIVNGGSEYAFANTPLYEENTLWLPCKEVLEMLDYPGIVAKRGVSCNHTDKEGNQITCFFDADTNDYSLDTASNVFLKASKPSFIRNDVLYIPEDEIEALTGDVFSYDPATGTLNFSLGVYSEFQQGNTYPLKKMILKMPSELHDNRLGSLLGGISMWDAKYPVETFVDTAKQSNGWSWISATSNDQDFQNNDWSLPDYYFTEKVDTFYKTLKDCGMKVTFNLIFLDRAYMGEANKTGTQSLHDPAQVQRYLDYVAQTVTHLKGLVDCYEIWNEQNITGSPQYIAVEDYISVVKQVYPLIKSIDPNAMVSIGETTSLRQPDSQAYMTALLSSDAVQYADRIAFHSFFWESPEFHPEYYYGYPQLIKAYMQTARDHGFQGDFWSGEGNYLSYDVVNSKTPDMIYAYTPAVSTKYIQRVDAMCVGLGLSGGDFGMTGNWESYLALGRLAQVFSGVSVDHFGIDIQSQVKNVASYCYKTDNGQLLGYWNDAAATDEDQIGTCSITIKQDGVQHVYLYDTIHGFYQEMNFDMTNGGVVVENIVIKDYPMYLLIN